MRGRKPKPTAKRIAEGNREHRTINHFEPRPEEKAPRRPRVLQGEERRSWRYLVRELDKMGTLASSDRGDMTAYCHWWGTLLKAKSKLAELKSMAGEKDAEVIKTASGNYIQNPWLGIANTAAKELTKVCEKMGLDPTSRTRIKLLERSDDNLADILSMPREKKNPPVTVQ